MFRPNRRPSERPATSRKPVTSRKARLAVQVLEGRVVPTAFSVTNLSNSGAGSLRQAIIDANANAGADTISIGVTGTVTLTTGELLINDDVTITGPGAANLRVSGNNATRVFDVVDFTADLSVTITGLTVMSGRITTGDGAGIYNGGEAVTLDGVVVSGNNVVGSSTDSGGGVAVGIDGTLTVRNSTVSGNTSTGRGGAIYFFNGGSLLVENSTLSGNAATVSSNGGAVYFYGPVGGGGATVRNSTISGNNSFNGSGGGIGVQAFSGTFLIQNSTITNNTAGTGTAAVGSGGGGVALSSGSAAVLTLQSSIVSGNTATNGRQDIAAFSNATVNVNNSAIGNSAGFTLSASSGSNLPFGATLLLGPLANNGGPTPTHSIAPTSPAVNAGSNPAVLSTDQRGGSFQRVVGAAADIGAFERNASDPINPVATGGPFANVTTAGVPTYQFTVTYTDVAALSVASLDGSDVRVTGPGGFNQLATFVTVSPPGDGSPRTATYSITAPTGNFAVAANGTYTIAVEPNQVFNTANLPVLPTTVGTFQVLVPNVITVTTDADSGAGSLRAAITSANSSPNVDTILFSTAFFGTTPRTIALATALGTITGPIVLAGPGADLLAVRRAAGAATNFRVFNFGGTAPFASTVSGVTVAGGTTTGTTLGTRGGAGIAINGTKTLTVLDSVITGNTASGEGGGLYVGTGGTLTLRYSTVSGNVSGSNTSAPYAAGGGIYMRSGGTLTVENSTISGNTAPGAGGGLYMYANPTPGSVTIRNSTVAGNSSGDAGGGIQFVVPAGTGHALLIQNSTIAFNTSTVRGGGLNLDITGAAATATIRSTVIANNTGPNPDAFGTITLTRGLIRNQTGVTLSGSSSNNLAAGTDPLFAAAGLADNGGPTQTIALQGTSPLINAGNNTANLTTDQRGFSPRVVGSAADIGAYEVSAVVPTPPTVAGVVVNDGDPQRSMVRSIALTFSEAVTFAGGNGNAANVFTLTRVADGAAVGLAATVSTNGLGQTVVTLTFTTLNAAAIDATSAQNGTAPSLADGVYRLGIANGAVTSTATGLALDGDGNGTDGGAYLSPQDTAGSGAGYFFGLYRLFGDATGNGLVDLVDLGALRGTFNAALGNPAYLNYLDADSNGNVDLVDLSSFRTRFNVSLF